MGGKRAAHHKTCFKKIQDGTSEAKTIHKASVKGYQSLGAATICRGEGWNRHEGKGRQSLENCAKFCTDRTDCTSFEHSTVESCWLFFHPNPDKVQAQRAAHHKTCYKKVNDGSDDDDDEEEKEDDGKYGPNTYKNPKNFGFENYGAHSRCFMAQDLKENKMKSACLRARCYNDKVYMKFGDEIFMCPSQGIFEVNLKAYKGKVACPDPVKFCGIIEQRCPFDCSGHGKCLGNGRCQCYTGFSGKDCNTCEGCKKESDPFVTGYERGYGKKSDPTKEKKLATLSHGKSVANTKQGCC